MTASPKTRLDPDARREAIIDVAQDIFLEEGYAATSMSTIAARLGGSKGTLYNYFKNKDELFEAFVQRRCFWHQEEIFGDLGPAPTARETLLSLAKVYLRVTLTDLSLRSLRLIIAEAERAPEIGRNFYESGPLRGAARLARMLDAWVASGELVVGDTLDAAKFFMGLCKSRFYMPRLLNQAPPPSEDEIAVEAERAVKAFFCLYGSDAEGSTAAP